MENLKLKKYLAKDLHLLLVVDNVKLKQSLTSRITSISDYRQDTPHTARPLAFIRKTENETTD